MIVVVLAGVVLLAVQVIILVRTARSRSTSATSAGAERTATELFWVILPGALLLLLIVFSINTLR